MADFYKNSDLICDDLRPKGVRGVKYILGELSIEPVKIQEFKDHAKIDFSTDDNLIATYITAARQTVERILRKSLGVRVVTFYAEYLPKRFKLDWGNYLAINMPLEGYTLFGKDILREGGSDIELTLTTENTVMNADIKNAILKQAFDYYEKRGVYTEGVINEVQNILRHYSNIQFP